MPLEDYKDVVGSIAGVITVGQMFSGVFVCRDIYKRGSAKSIPPATFVGPLMGGMMMFLQGLIVQDKTLGIVNFIGISLSLSYNAFYLLWSDRENKINYFKALVRSLLFVVAIFCYISIEDPEKVAFRYGLIMTAFMFYFLSAPLFNIKEIIRTKNTESIPFAMVLGGTLTSSSWLLYTYIINQPFLIFQNAMFCTLCSIQLGLCLKYPNKPPEKAE